MKYNIFCLLSLCGILFASCQNEPETDNEINPGHETGSEQVEVRFSFSFDAVTDTGIEYEPLTRGGETDWGRMKISNTFHYILLREDINIYGRVYYVARKGTSVFDSQSEPYADIYIPGEHKFDFITSLAYNIEANFLFVVFTGAKSVTFNDEIKEGDSFTPNGKIPNAIRYTKQEVKIKDNDNTTYSLNMLDEPVFYGEAAFHLHLRADRMSPPALCIRESLGDDCASEPIWAEEVPINFVNKVSKFRPVFGSCPEEELAMPEESARQEPLVFVSPYRGQAPLPEGLDILGNPWYPEVADENNNGGLFCYPLDPLLQTGKGGEYLTGTHQPGTESYMYMFYSANEPDVIVMDSPLIVPAGAVSLYATEEAWESYQPENPGWKGDTPLELTMGQRVVREQLYGIYLPEDTQANGYGKLMHRKSGTGELLFPHNNEYRQTE